MKLRSWTGLRIALYARYSSDQQRETSLDDQRRRAEAMAADHEGTISPDLMFMDSAISGATLQRPEFQKLMQAVDEGRVDVILTEDVSRMSRNLAHAAGVLKRLQDREVMLVGIADGIEYSHEDSFMVFGMKAMMSQAYLHDLRYKTKRGLEGRMLAGRSTGGRLLGYRTEVEKGPTGKVIGAKITVEPEEKKVVRRIFEMSAAGHSLLSIARTLNVEGVPVLRPHRKNRRRGWIASTVRAILHNETYVGRRSYMKKEWRRDPDSGKRRYRKRTDGVMTQEQPELRIIDDELWNAVQARLSAVRAKYTPKTTVADGAVVVVAKRTGLAGRVTKFPFSGLLICSCCGTPMVIAGGTPNRLYRCGDVSKRGICENRLPVQERLVRAALLGALREHITSPWAVAYVRKRWAETVGDAARKNDEDLRMARSRLQRADQRLKNFALLWVDGERSDEIRLAWDDTKAEAAGLRSLVSTLEAASHEPPHLPTPAEVEERVLDLHRLAQTAPVEARQVLGTVFGEGQIQMLPQPDGSYIAKTEILPLVLIAATRNPRPGSPNGGLVYFRGCAGRT